MYRRIDCIDVWMYRLYRVHCIDYFNVTKNLKIEKKMEDELEEFEDIGGVFSTEMFETNLRIEGEMRGTL